MSEPIKDEDLRHGQAVIYEARVWLVWAPAPGAGLWTLVRYDAASESKCASVEAHYLKMRRP